MSETETCRWCGETFLLLPDDNSGYYYLGDLGTVPLCNQCFSSLAGVLL